MKLDKKNLVNRRNFIASQMAVYGKMLGLNDKEISKAVGMFNSSADEEIKNRT